MDVSSRVRLRRNVLYFAALARDNARFNRQSVIYTIKNFRVPTRGFHVSNARIKCDWYFIDVTPSFYETR